MAAGRPIQALDHDRERPRESSTRTRLSLLANVASKIEPAAPTGTPCRGASGAAHHINDETKSFVERTAI
jgi:hypothetical protein